jgi:hypothetical protein
MKKNESTKTQNSKKDKEKVKDKDKPKENEKEKKIEESDSEESYYTPEEIILLDKLHEFSEHKFEDDDIYEIMIKYNNDEELIKNEIKEMLKELKRGAEFSWTEIGKSN